MKTGVAGLAWIDRTLVAAQIMTDPHPKQISVIIPVRNEASSIDQLLRSLLDQTLAPHEIVITDGGSIDATIKIIQGYIDQGAAVRLIKTSGALPGRGRNLSAAESKGEWLAFTDGGNRPAKDWLEALAATAESEGADVVYGSYEPVIDSFFRECAAIAYVSPPQEIDGKLSRSNFIASTLLRREAWAAVGGFPENLRSAEDLVFMRAVEAANFRIARAPHAVVYWTIQPNLYRTFKRFVVYARNNIRAGLFWQWQGTILIYYALIGASLTSHLRFGVKALLGPPVLWVLLLAARAAKALYRYRFIYPAGIAHNLARLSMIMVIIATLDLAAFIGSVHWLLADKLRVTGVRSA